MLSDYILAQWEKKDGLIEGDILISVYNHSEQDSLF